MLRLPSCFLFGLTPAITGRQRAAKAKRRPYVAVVLSRSEVEAVLSHLETRIVSLRCCFAAAGCGFRNAWNSASNASISRPCYCTVHDGKGQKDRTVPLPRRVLPGTRLVPEPYSPGQRPV